MTHCKGDRAYNKNKIVGRLKHCAGMGTVL